MEVTFTINGKTFTATPSTVPVDTTLNNFIRLHAKLPGTKFMCLEGGCGACIVSVQGVHPVSKTRGTWAVNSCLVNIYSCHGLDVTTIEGLGNKKQGYHTIQKRLANFNGTQCGYCSPGMVMNMHSLLASKNGQVSMKEVENSFGGNICRCTGYRPILDAFKSLAHDADEKLLEVCRDIEDLDKVCPKTGSPCSGKCSVAGSSTVEPLHLFFADDKEWHKVNTVAEIFTIFESLAEKPYMLVAGNTAHGVYRRNPDLKAFIDITGVEELCTHSVGESIELGGGLSLTETMEILTKAAANPKFEYAKEIVKHIDLIANVPVRNIGTLAGNLSIKNQHKEFPSDIFITFEGAGATITVSEGGDKTKTLSPAEFVKEDMTKKVCLKISLPALDSSKFVYRSYKIMPRAQNAHAYVNASFLFEFDENKEKVESARICFGGIEPDFIHAKLTEEFLVGKELYTDEVLEEALTIMSEEIQPDWVLPDAVPEYRKKLALSLFYKFVLNTCPDDKMNPKHKTGGEIYDRPVSSGVQTFDTNKENWPLNKNIPKIEGMIQCSGEAEYTNDVAAQPHEVWAAFVEGTEVHAQITDIDTSDALAIPGVVAFYGLKDIPGKNNFMPDKIPFTTEKEEVFCSGEVLYHGQPVGIIVADSFALAHQAAKMVKIHYERRTHIPIVTTSKQALDEGHKDRLHLISQNSYEAGETGQQDVSGRFEIGSQYHYTMETQSCVCIPSDEGMEVYSATQWIDNTQIAISDVLGVPENSLNLRVKRLGGAYGGKISRSSQVACACALAAHLLNRPVRFVMSLESNMNSIGKRYACISNYEVEYDRDGKITKLDNDFVQDYGCSLNEGVVDNTSAFFRNCYEKNGWNVKANAAKTDAPSHTWCRAPGTTEGIAMIENIMEHIAHKMEKEPVEVRLANMSKGNEMKKMLPDFAKSVDYYNRKAAIDDFNRQNRWRKRGIAIVPMEYALHYFGTLHATVSVYHADGTVSISHGGIEMGQGINTKAAQVAAHILGIPLESIAVKATNSFTSPNDIVTGGSMTSEIVAFAVKKACEQLLDRMKPIRDELKSPKWMDVTHACFNKNIDLCSNFMYKMGDAQTYNIWGCSCIEVDLDLLTGNVQVVRADILEDTGESLSPGIDIGQVEGAFVMGLGYWLNESLIYNNENGELLTNRTWTYKPPGAKDIPIDFRITFLQKSSNPFGVLRSKATGEPALCMSIVVIFALRHALNSARQDARLGDDWFNLGAPSQAEHLFLAAGNSLHQYKLN